jgi:hypothetical protein
MTTREELDEIRGMLKTLAVTVVAHDNQIESLIKISEENARNWEQLRREFQAYLNTLHPRQ